jgi:hypothetical protein
VLGSVDPDAGEQVAIPSGKESVMTWVETAPDSRDMDNVLASHSLNREALEGHLALYRTVMFGPSGLSRAEREAMAVFVSAANDCHY